MKTINIFTINLLILFFVQEASCQWPFRILPQFSQREMFEDFDYLVQTLEAVNPQFGVRKKVTGFDNLKEIKKLRIEINSIKRTKDFIFLINDIFNLCHDAHIRIEPWYYSFGDSLNPIFQGMANKLSVKYSDRINFNNEFCRWPADIKKINDKYYYIGAYTWKIKMKRDTIPEESLLLSIDGKNINDIIAENIRVSPNIRWDYQQKTFYRNPPFINKKSIKKGLKYKIMLPNNNIKTLYYKPWLHLFTGTTHGYKYKDIRIKKVEYFDKDRILYIRVPEMSYEDYFRQQIPKISNGKIIDKVIIDIRGNRGGSDYVWSDIIEQIISEPLITNLKFGIKNNDKVIKHLHYNKDSLKKEKISFLDNEEFLIKEEKEITRPADNSINYKGTIYILQDYWCFSAAGSLNAMAEYHENIISVGEPTGKILGRGETPIGFVLPNSKLIFTIEPVIDLTNAKNPIDIYHDKVEIPVYLDSENVVKSCNYTGERFGEYYLYNHDPVFQKVMELE